MSAQPSADDRVLGDRPDGDEDEAPIDPAELKARLIEDLHDELGRDSGSSAKWVVVAIGAVIFAGLLLMLAVAVRTGLCATRGGC